ncbi:hypothetical protein TEA_014205 [Camellia sinensis var. sinensis]|uniref:ABC transporter domain-containing protein n=1 Tax=Camellia sinensis var. sinensis TaxID=542762 RepID=A0A4S4EDS1_CAMSN|nr:hypothetical protein TEA_014205 [Camellia sinensis var. sinensis]
MEPCNAKEGVKVHDTRDEVEKDDPGKEIMEEVGAANGMLRDIAIPKDLNNNLEILSLQGSNIKVLPSEIGQLTRLRLLDLGNCEKLTEIPQGVLSNLSRLEELYIFDASWNWEERSKVILDELGKLTQLTTSQIHIPNVMLLPKDFCFENFIRFKISMGKEYGFSETYSKSYKLRGVSLRGKLIVLLMRAEELHLKKIEGLQEVGISLLPVCVRGFPRLQRLQIVDCEMMEAIVGIEEEKDEDELSSQVINFSQLKYLDLVNLPKLISFYPKVEKMSTSEGNSSTQAQSLFNEKKLKREKAIPVSEICWVGKPKSICSHAFTSAVAVNRAWSKSVALASGGVIVAGGVAAYIRSRYSCKKPESIAHCNGLSDHKEQSNKIVKNEKVSNESKPPKKEGPPLKLVAAILLSHMSLRGARDLMALLIIAVKPFLLSNLEVQGLVTYAMFCLATLHHQLICLICLKFDSPHMDRDVNMAYYKLSYVDGRIRNPEQRIASDVPRFCTELSEFLQENVMAAFDGVLYTWSLWEYRQLHSRLRTHAESIAIYGGENREESHIQQKFKALIQHMGVVLHHNWWFGIAQDLIFRCLGAIVAGTLMIEPFFLGKLRPGSSALGRAETLSNLKYHSSVIIALFTSLGILFGNPMKIDRLRGYAGRILELMTISKELSVNDASSLQGKGSGNCVTEANYIEFDGVKVVTPTGNVLVEDLTLKVESGSNLLVTGPNGSGKSSLFRVLGGLWPLMSGHLVKPGVGSDLNKEIFYVPQRPYTVVGTLRDQLIYPLTADEEVEPLTHDELVDLLKYVDLEYLLDRYPLEKEINWGDELSLGEQQRLGMARLFYHKPKFAILDECTSAVTSDMEERFCARVQAMGMSCITISHRPALVAFHDVVLSLDGEGGWKVQYKREDSAVRSTESGFDAMELSETDRQSDAMAVQRAFAMTKMDSLSSNAKSQSYISELTAASPPMSHGAPLPIIPQLQSASRPLISRVAAMFKILVPTMFDKQGAQILSVAILIGLTSLLGNTAGFLQAKTTKFVLEQDTTSYIRYFGAAMVLNFASSFMSPSLRHLTSKLALEWRIRLTQHLLKHYFRKDAYYKVFNMSDTNVDADQRITQDVEKLTTDLSTLVAGMVKPSVDMIWFTWRMKELTGRRGVSILYAYMILGLGFLKNFTPDFGGLASREQQLEGTFRYMHERLRTHAESVAFFGGGAREKAMVESRLRDLLDHSKLHNKKKWLFGVLDDFISRHLPQSVASSELADGLRYVTSIVSSSFASFGEMLQLNKTYVELSGGINRVFELEELLDAAQSGGSFSLPTDGHISTSTLSPTKPTTTHSADIISFSDVDIITPGQKMLARKLKFQILPEKGLLVTGPNGSGKSCVFRVLRGLWPLVSGKLVKPCQRIGEEAGRGRGVFYVPQRSYMCLGTLRDQIIYPLSREEAEQMALDLYGKGETSIDAPKLLDSHLETILENVKLLYLLEREGGWDANKTWEDILSLGEQQRLGMARLFFHKPKFGVLDECTNATSIDIEEHLYKLANDMGITLVTSSQRPALIPYHSTELRLVDEQGGRGGLGMIHSIAILWAIWWQCNIKLFTCVVDGAWKQSTEVAGLAWVSAWMKLKCRCRNKVLSIWLSSPLLAEARALLEAIKWVVKMKICCLSIFTDCKILVDSFEQQSDPDWEVALVVQDVLAISKQFQFLSVTKQVSGGASA